MPASPAPIAAGTRIGHVHLKVADLSRALDFYVGVLGFQLMQKYGTEAAFISAGGYHHHLGLNTWESRGGTPPPPGHTGLFHTAILYPTRAALADALRRLIAAKIPLDGASDHGGHLVGRVLPGRPVDRTLRLGHGFRPADPPGTGHDAAPGDRGGLRRAVPGRGGGSHRGDRGRDRGVGVDADRDGLPA